MLLRNIYISFRSFVINNILSRIRYLRYPSNYIKFETKNLNKIKNISQKLNKKEFAIRKNFREILSKTYSSNYFTLDKELIINSEGYKIIRFDYLKKIEKYLEAFKYFENKFRHVETKNMKKNSLFFHSEISFENNFLRDVVSIFLPSISEYLNILPVVSAANLWYSEPTNNQSNYMGSQLPHFDYEDLKQIKMYLALNDINDGEGPMHVLDKNQSAIIKRNLNDKKIEIDTKISEKFFSNYNFKKVLLKKGDVFLVDTSSCYHFGGRCHDNPRKQVMLQFNDPFCGIYPLIRFKKNYEDLVWDFAKFSYPNIKKLKIKNLKNFKIY